MLSKEEAILIAKKYLKNNGHPFIEESGDIEFPDDKENPESRECLLKNNWCVVSFLSKVDPDNPYKDLIPMAFIVYINYYTGEVFMPRHM